MAATETRAPDESVRHRSNPWRVALAAWSTQRWGLVAAMAAPTAPVAASESEHPAEHRLEVARFLHVGHERMVGAGA